MKNIIKQFLKIIGKIVLGFLVLLVFIVGFGKITSIPPSDAAITKIYNRNKSDLNRIKTMFLEDGKFSRIGPDFIHSRVGIKPFSFDHKELGVSDERMREYRKLFKRVGIRKGVRGGDNYIYFIVKSWGFLDSTGSKGILWLRNPEKHLKESREEIKHIELNWYMD